MDYVFLFEVPRFAHEKPLRSGKTAQARPIKTVARQLNLREPRFWLASGAYDPTTKAWLFPQC
jgi:hypothetical protein